MARAHELQRFAGICDIPRCHQGGQLPCFDVNRVLRSSVISREVLARLPGNRLWYFPPLRQQYPQYPNRIASRLGDRLRFLGLAPVMHLLRRGKNDVRRIGRQGVWC